MKQTLTTFLATVIGTCAFAEDVTVNIGSFIDPTSFTLSSETIPFRFSELSSSGGSNSATHIILEGLYPVSDGSTVHSSNYRALDLDNSGAVQDVGVVYVDLPSGAALPEGTVASPIVGVVQRSGSWSNYALSTPTTTVGDSTGTSTYDAESGVIDFSLSRNSEAFSGSTNYTVLDEDTIEIDAFTLIMDGTTSYAFDGAVLVRDDSRFYGTIYSTDASPDFDSLIFSIEITGIPDLDGDGIPDISDLSIDGGGNGPVLTPEGYTFHEGIGWTYGYSAEIGYSLLFGFVYVNDWPYIYLYSHGWGWIVLVDSTEGQDGSGNQTFFNWYYSGSLEWIYLNTNEGGWFRASSVNYSWNNFINPIE